MTTASDEMRVALVALNASILKLVEAFETETGLRVQSIGVERAYTVGARDRTRAIDATAVLP